MKRFGVGDRVRVDIPDSTDPDFERLHGREGIITEIFEDEASRETGDERDSYLFSVELSNGQTEHLRWRDLRPAPNQ